MFSHVVCLDTGIFGEQDLRVNYRHSAGVEPRITIDSVFWSVSEAEIPEAIWRDSVFLDNILDILSSVHSEDYRNS